MSSPIRSITCAACGAGIVGDTDILTCPCGAMTAARNIAAGEHYTLTVPTPPPKPVCFQVNAIRHMREPLSDGPPGIDVRAASSGNWNFAARNGGK